MCTGFHNRVISTIVSTADKFKVQGIQIKLGQEIETLMQLLHLAYAISSG